jgi:hypothetical protein
MHTLLVIATGLGVLAACLLAGHAFGAAPGTARAALCFLPLWFLGAAFNMYLGMRTAGYGFRGEAPVFLLVFAVPALVALLCWWRFAQSR